MEELVKSEKGLDKFCSMIFIDSEIDESIVYADIEKELGSLVVLEKQDNWCFLDDSIYAININRYDENDLKSLFDSIINRRIKIFLTIVVDIQRDIEFNQATDLLKYLLTRSFKNKSKSSIFSILELSSFVYLLSRNYFISKSTYINDNNYINLKNRQKSISIVYYSKYREDTKNFYTRLLGINYKYFNPNPRGFEYIAREIATNDCLIRALCALTGNYYNEVYENLYVISAGNYTMTNKITNAVLYLKKCFIGKFKLYMVKKFITVGEIINNFPDKKMLISNGNHIVFEYNKTIYDNSIYHTDNFILSRAKYVIVEDIDSELFREVTEDKF